MHNPQKYIPGLVISLFYPRFHDVAQRCVAGLVALHYLARTLVYYDYMIVFVYYFHTGLLFLSTKIKNYSLEILSFMLILLNLHCYTFLSLSTMRKILSFYIDGFKSMTVGKQLWALIIIKLFIFFAILKLFFFPDVLAQKTPPGSDASDTVRNELINRTN
jgi:hypothetical protein